MKTIILLMAILFISSCASNSSGNKGDFVHVNEEVSDAVCYFQSKDNKDYLKQNNLMFTHYDGTHYYLITNDQKPIAVKQRNCLLKMKLKANKPLADRTSTKKLIICNISENYEFIGDDFFIVKSEESNFVLAEHSLGEIYYFPREYCSIYDSVRRKIDPKKDPYRDLKAK